MSKKCIEPNLARKWEIWGIFGLDLEKKAADPGFMCFERLDNAWILITELKRGHLRKRSEGLI